MTWWLSIDKINYPVPFMIIIIIIITCPLSDRLMKVIWNDEMLDNVQTECDTHVGCQSSISVLYFVWVVKSVYSASRLGLKVRTESGPGARVPLHTTSHTRGHGGFLIWGGEFLKHIIRGEKLYNILKIPSINKYMKSRYKRFSFLVLIKMH